MKVTAIGFGYFDHIRRREGDVFSIPDAPRRKPSPKELQYHGEAMKLATDKNGEVPQAYSGVWMRPVKENTPERVTTSQKALDRRTEEIRQEKAGTLGADANADVI